METLIDALSLYANENLIPRFMKETSVQTRAAWRKVEQLTSQLKALGPEETKQIEELEGELLTINSNCERAALLAGISIGLELGRL